MMFAILGGRQGSRWVKESKSLYDQNIKLDTSAESCNRHEAKENSCGVFGTVVFYLSLSFN